MKLAQLKAFLQVLDSGSFSEAALETSSAQSAVSYAVAELERELGVKLLTRGRFGAAPTEVGLRVAEHARQMLRSAEAIVQEASLERGAVRGVLRVGTFPSVAAQILPTIIASLRAAHPDLALQLVEVNGAKEELWQLLRQGQVDISFLSGYSGEAFPDESITWELLHDPYVALVPQGFALENEGCTVTLEALRAHPLIVYEDPACSAYIRDLLSYPPSYIVREDSTILSMVAQGIGVSVVPTLAFPHLPPSVKLLPLAQAIERTIAIAILPDSLKVPAVRVFLDALKQRFPDSTLPRLEPHRVLS